MDIIVFMIVAAALGFVGGMRASRWATRRDRIIRSLFPEKSVVRGKKSNNPVSLSGVLKA